MPMPFETNVEAWKAESGDFFDHRGQCATLFLGQRTCSETAQHNLVFLSKLSLRR